MMTIFLRFLAAITVLSATMLAGDLEQALDRFADYRHGGPKKALHETRLTALRGTDDPGRRGANERLLLAFVQSDATRDARREACLWLSDLATETSRPVLEKLAGRPDFADVAQIALDAIAPGEPADDPPPASELARFRAAAMAADDPLEELTAAMSGGDERLARLAFEMVREGVATEAACAWLVGNMGRLSAPRQVVAMNVLSGLDAARAGEVIARLAKEGEGEAKAAAIGHLGALGRKEDVAWLMKLGANSDEAFAAAAQSALLGMPDEVLHDGLLQALRGAEPAAQATAIELAAARGAAEAGEELFRIAANEDNTNRGAAAGALGSAAPVETFARLIRAFAEAHGTPVEQDLKAAVWTMARRQADYDKAGAVMREHGTQAPQRVRAALESMASKLATLKPAMPLQPPP